MVSHLHVNPKLQFFKIIFLAGYIASKSEVLHGNPSVLLWQNRIRENPLPPDFLKIDLKGA